MKRWLIILALVPPALITVGLLLTLIVVVLRSAPPLVASAAVVMLGVCVCWFIFARRRGSKTIVSETSLLGRQSSKEGLL